MSTELGVLQSGLTGLVRNAVFHIGHDAAYRIGKACSVMESDSKDAMFTSIEVRFDRRCLQAFDGDVELPVVSLVVDRDFDHGGKPRVTAVVSHSRLARIPSVDKEEGGATQDRYVRYILRMPADNTAVSAS